MLRKEFLILLAATVIFAFAGGLTAVVLFQGNNLSANGNTEESPVRVQARFSLEQEFKLPEGHFIGVVENGQLNLVVPKQAFKFPIRLTGIQMQEARPAESMEISLTQYEGKVIMISGHNGGGWIYRAAVVDSGGPLLKALVQKVFQNRK